jgi:hypothetical protein
MSAKCTAFVWNNGYAKGSELLVLLAIADEAKDDGCLYRVPMHHLATKTRLTRRQVQRILRQLETSGELLIRQSHGGNNRKNQYRLNMPVRGARGNGKS